jgi:long-subunit fatty acid transport protein
MGGASAADVSDATAVVSNPARLLYSGKSDLYLESSDRSEIRWMGPLSDGMSLRPVFPFFMGMKIGLGCRCAVGWAYDRPYGLWLDLGDRIQVGENGESMVTNMSSRATVQRFSFALGWLLTPFLSVGFTYEDHHAHVTDDYGDIFNQGTEEYTYAGHGQSFLVGMNVAVSNLLTIGLTYRPRYSIDGSEEFRINEPEVRYKNTIPSMVRMGCFYVVRPNLHLALDFDMTFWSSVEEYQGQKHYRDVLDLFNGAELKIDEHVTLRWGYCTHSDPWIRGSRPIGENQNFLTCGATIQVKNGRLGIAILDSHLLHSEDVEVTEVMLSLGYGR